MNTKHLYAIMIVLNVVKKLVSAKTTLVAIQLVLVRTIHVGIRLVRAITIHVGIRLVVVTLRIVLTALVFRKKRIIRVHVIIIVN